jgi:hypothetical protein
MGDRFYSAQKGKGNAKGPKLFGKETFAMSFDNNIADQLKAFGDNFVDQYCRPAAYVAATVFYHEMRTRVPVRTGDLKNSIYRWRDKANTQTRATFYVGPNKRIAPHWHLVEYGHWATRRVYFDKRKQQYVTTKQLLARPYLVAARPYIRPTLDTKRNEAIQAGIAELKRRIKNRQPFIAQANDI